MARAKQLPPRSKVKPSDTWDLAPEELAALRARFQGALRMELVLLAPALWPVLMEGVRRERGRKGRLNLLPQELQEAGSALVFKRLVLACAIGIGVLFLVTAGTANLGGVLDADTAVEVQGWLARVTGSISNLAVALAVTLAVMFLLVIRIRRSSKVIEDQHRTDHQAAAGPRRES